MRKKTLNDIVHRYYAVECNNALWQYLENKKDEDALQEMIDCAHAAAHHWRKVGTVINQIRADYMIARTYVAAKRAEPALHHAKRCFALVENNITEAKDFDIAYASEIMWRASALSKDDKADAFKERATQLAKEIKDPEDRKIFDTDFKAVL